MIVLTWEDVLQQVENLCARQTKQYTGVYGIPSGGAPVAALVANKLNLQILDTPQDGCLVVDDLIDTGATFQKFGGYNCDALYRKNYSPADVAPQAHTVNDWLSFPWEKHDGEPTDGITRLLQYIGEDPTREGLQETPKRFVKAFKEMTEGYNQNPKQILSTTFNEARDQMIVVKDIEFVSMCEHHLAPFRGIVTVGYIPDGKVVGLSKIPRLVDAYAHRLQIQERFTQEIADSISDILTPMGVGVLVTAHHSCMGNRGIRKHGASMTTSAMLGVFRDNPETRQEFMNLSHIK